MTKKYSKSNKIKNLHFDYKNSIRIDLPILSEKIFNLLRSDSLIKENASYERTFYERNNFFHRKILSSIDSERYENLLSGRQKEIELKKRLLSSDQRESMKMFTRTVDIRLGKYINKKDFFNSQISLEINSHGYINPIKLSFNLKRSANFMSRYDIEFLISFYFNEIISNCMDINEETQNSPLFLDDTLIKSSIQELDKYFNVEIIIENSYHFLGNYLILYFFREEILKFLDFLKKENNEPIN